MFLLRVGKTLGTTRKRGVWLYEREACAQGVVVIAVDALDDAALPMLPPCSPFRFGYLWFMTSENRWQGNAGAYYEYDPKQRVLFVECPKKNRLYWIDS